MNIYIYSDTRICMYIHLYIFVDTHIYIFIYIYKWIIQQNTYSISSQVFQVESINTYYIYIHVCIYVYLRVYSQKETHTRENAF